MHESDASVSPNALFSVTSLGHPGVCARELRPDVEGSEKTARCAARLQVWVVNDWNLPHVVFGGCIYHVLSGCDVHPAADVNYSKEASASTSAGPNRFRLPLGCASVQVKQIRQSSIKARLIKGLKNESGKHLGTSL